MLAAVKVAPVIKVIAPLLAGAAHFRPVACALSAVKTVLLAPTPRRVSEVLKVYRSPFVVKGDAAPTCM